MSHVSSVGKTDRTVAEQNKHYGRVRVSSIDVKSDVKLVGTDVLGFVKSEGKVIAINANAESIECEGSAEITNSYIREIQSEGNVEVTNSICDKIETLENATLICSKIYEEISATSKLSATLCELLGNIESDGSVEIDHCASVRSIAANGLILKSSRVEKFVSVGKNPSIKKSEIKGKLSCSANHLIIEDSTIDTIEIDQQNSSPVIELHNCIVRDIIFKSGNGEVIFIRDSKVTGEITGNKK